MGITSQYLWFFGNLFAPRLANFYWGHFIEKQAVISWHAAGLGDMLRSTNRPPSAQNLPAGVCSPYLLPALNR